MTANGKIDLSRAAERVFGARQEPALPADPPSRLLCRLSGRHARRRTDGGRRRLLRARRALAVAPPNSCADPRRAPGGASVADVVRAADGASWVDAPARRRIDGGPCRRAGRGRAPRDGALRRRSPTSSVTPDGDGSEPRRAGVVRRSANRRPQLTARHWRCASKDASRQVADGMGPISRDQATGPVSALVRAAAPVVPRPAEPGQPVLQRARPSSAIAAVSTPRCSSARVNAIWRATRCCARSSPSSTASRAGRPPRPTAGDLRVADLPRPRPSGARRGDPAGDRGAPAPL